MESGKEISTKLVLFSFFVKTLKLLDTTPSYKIVLVSN